MTIKQELSDLKILLNNNQYPVQLPKSFYNSPSSKEIASTNSDTSHWNLYSGRSCGKKEEEWKEKTDQASEKHWTIRI